jgi:ATP-dependent RNA helicase DeaD
LLSPEKPKPERTERFDRGERTERGHADRGARPSFDRGDRPQFERAERPARPKKDIGPRGAPDAGMETYRIEVGYRHGVKPGNIVGAIANEADLESRFIGRIDIHDDYSLLDLPEGMPPELMSHLQKVRVAGQPMRLHRLGEEAAGAASSAPSPSRRPPPRPRHRKGPPPRADARMGKGMG